LADICLIQMPYSAIYMPSLALGILKSCLTRDGFSCRVFYGDMMFADILGYENYQKFLDKRIIYQFGEASFAPAAWGREEGNTDSDRQEVNREYLEKVIEPLEGDTAEYEEVLKAVWKVIPDYLQKLAADIMKEKPLIVGCSSNFQQNNASFAILKEIKRIAPHMITIMGGSNCALDAGQAIASEVEWVDYTFSGEGESSIPEFCRLAGRYGKNIPTNLLPAGVMSAQTADRKPVFPRTKDLNSIPLPDFDEYFEETEKMSWMNRDMISLTAESSRGCWWREKQGCTFCGLCMKNGEYHRKKPEYLLRELLLQSERYGTKRFFLTDSILGSEMEAEFPELIDALPENPGFHLFAEVKSNMEPEELLRLKRAGFDIVQPGIEAVQDDLLRLMNKGNRAIRHLEFLKSAKRCKMKLSWNLLFGFPGEEEEWVEETLNLIPLLTHLPPPNGAMHILYQKYSHYYENCKDYGLRLERLPSYDYIYGFQEMLAAGTAYNFYPANEENLPGYYDLRKKGRVYEELVRAVVHWKERYYNQGDCLQMVCYENRLEIMDLRESARHSLYEFTGEEKELCLFCDSPKKKRDILAYMGKLGQEAEETNELISKMLFNRLFVEIGEEILALAVCIERGK